MIKNIGKLDQILRLGISFGLIFISLINEQFIQDSLSSYIIATLGFIIAVTAIVRFCPFYWLTGINTCLNNKKP